MKLSALDLLAEAHVGYRYDVLKMQQDLLEQGWDDVVLGTSKSNKENLTLTVSKTGYNSQVLTALPSFTTMWSSRIHTISTSAANMLSTMQRKLDDLNRDLAAN